MKNAKAIKKLDVVLNQNFYFNHLLDVKLQLKLKINIMW